MKDKEKEKKATLKNLKRIVIKKMKIKEILDNLRAL